jgi:hypothetical protein
LAERLVEMKADLRDGLSVEMMAAESVVQWEQHSVETMAGCLAV